MAGNVTAKGGGLPILYWEAVRMTKYERLVLCIMLAELIVNVLALLNKLL